LSELFTSSADKPRRKHHESQASQSTVWLTPPGILKPLGEFDLDPCAAPAPRPWSTARVHWVQGDGSLLRAWFGRVWLNPPYGSVAVMGPWMRRMAAHGSGVALIFARTETELFFETVWNAAAALLFLKGRVVFHRPDGSLPRNDVGGGQAGAPSVLVAYVHKDAAVLSACGIEGKFVPLLLPRSVALMGIAALDAHGTDAATPAPSWRQCVIAAMQGRGAVATDELYRLFARHPKAAGKRFWREKIRQTLQEGPFRRLRAGLWALEEGAA